MKCFIDTNSLIHYQIFSKIDWLKETGCQIVDIVICPTVLSELDKKKFSEPDINIRNRCKTVISELKKYLTNPFINKNTSISFISDEPNINWNAYGLHSDIPDDRIIASILSQNSIKDIILVTSDLGLCLKANSKKIAIHSLHEDLLIKVKADKRDEEIRKLKEKVVSLENRLPLLKLYIIDGKDFSDNINFTYKRVEPLDKKLVDTLIEQEKNSLIYTPKEKIDTAPKNPMAEFTVPDKSEIERYTKDTDAYLKSLYEYYIEDWERKDILSRMFSLRLALRNTGTEPAEDIDIYLHFPNGFSMFKNNPYKNELVKPHVPQKPQSAIEQLQSRASLASLFSNGIGNIRVPSMDLAQKNISGPNIKESNSYDVEYRIEHLKHKMCINLDPIYFYFKSYEDIRSFTFENKISIGNHPDITSSKLSVIFQ